MDENTRFVVGLDVGTENVRATVGNVAADGTVNIVGYGEAQNGGMRKGVVANLSGPGAAIDRMLGEVERMSGYEVNSAFVSVNGAEIASAKVDGMIAVGTMEHEITDEDLGRVEDVAITGRVNSNREVLMAVPLGYTLDGQRGIKNPLGMTGSRLEMQACVVSGLAPNCENLRRATMSANVAAERLVPSVVAGAEAILSERQKENGVAVIDFGAATTSIAIYEEGDLQYVGVIPAGSINVTNDLAIVLGVDTETAETLKRKYVNLADNAAEKPVSVKVGQEELVFERAQIDQVARERMSEILAKIQGEMRVAKYERRLPEGVVLIGGGAKTRGLDKFVKQTLEVSTKIGVPMGAGGVADAVEKPEYAAAVGLMLMAAHSETRGGVGHAPKKGGKSSIFAGTNGASLGFLKKFFGKK